MDTVLSEAPVTSNHAGEVAPRALFLSVGAHTCEALLTAATEGTMRFVASAPADPRRGGSRIPSALGSLSAQCGTSLGIDDVEAMIVQGQPLAVLLVGDPNETDRATLHAIERDGIARIHQPFETPPRKASRLADWVRRVMTSTDGGAYEAMIVVLPIGMLPVWAAQLINALSASSAEQPRAFLVVASGASISEALPSSAQFIERNSALEHALGGALLALRSRHIMPDLPAHMRVATALQMVIHGVAFARQQTNDTIIYVDVADGSTAVIAHPHGVAVLHDAECDAAAGAATLLQRIGAEEIARWIPFEIDTTALRSWAIRRISAPYALLTDARDCTIAGGFARAALRTLIAQESRLPTPTRCLIGPSLARSATPPDVMRIVADVLHTSSRVEIAADMDGLLPIAGYYATRSPDCARSLLTHDLFVPFGTLLTLPPSGRRAESVVTTVIAGEAGSSRTAIAQDGLTTVHASSTGSVRIIRRDGREESVTAHGGPHGILVDTRSRPLTRGGGTAIVRGSVSDRLRADLSADAARHE